MTPGDPWALVFEGNPLPMWISGSQSLCFLDVNRAAVQHCGWSRDDFLAMTLHDIRPEGEAVWARAAVTPTECTDAEAPAFVAVVQDIDAQRSNQLALERQHALAAWAGRTARLGGWEVSLPDRHLHWPEALRAIMDMPPGGVVATVEENLSWYLPESRERVTRALDDCLESGQAFERAEAARALRPGLKILYTSGYTEKAIVHHGRLDAGVQLLPKPCRNVDLAAKVHAVLQKRGEEAR